MPIDLPARTRTDAVASLRQYFEDERGEPLGELAAGLLLDHVIAQIGPSLYNRGVRDAQARVQALLADLDVDLRETEFPDLRRVDRR